MDYCSASLSSRRLNFRCHCSLPLNPKAASSSSSSSSSSSLRVSFTKQTAFAIPASWTRRRRRRRNGGFYCWQKLESLSSQRCFFTVSCMAADNNRQTEAKVPEHAEAEAKAHVEALEARVGLGKRAPKQRRRRGESLQVGNRDKSQSVPRRKKDSQKMHRSEDKDVEDAAAEADLEALFSQLEQDLEKADLSGEDSSNTITEEELVAFEQDLSSALDAEEEEDLTKAPYSKKLMKESDKILHSGTSQKHGQVQDNKNFTVSQGDIDKNSKRLRKFDASRQLDIGNSTCLGRDMKTGYMEKGEAADNPHHILDDVANTVADDGKEEGESEDGERVVKLEKWQLKKLASAAEVGRRRVNIKSLAAEVGLDRSDVLSFLRDPPPELLTAVFDETSKELDNSASEIIDKTSNHRENGTPVRLDEKKKGPHTSKPGNWYSQKRLRKEVLNTFELVYRRTNRPTNSMIQNIVELTHVPKRRILQWFEDRRGENVSKNSTLEKLAD